ncbi:ATP-binding cassette domain-containing protein [Pseudoclavibacter sp. RFBB5]|uniref:ATP-binding cassette domain-containing protein n=1 Tax=Pseudoclavibacter sp. RFBB5 TaxID=2080574 RepID=UPI000CE78108|nr:ATP-binding cassette domain-containing protein [Pseudoclavibacter sp. RFBB5]PPG33572.1 peptide ABC transporter ATP-binding protein [Pseudoclavibacter sp. RFBB5]
MSEHAKTAAHLLEVNDLVVKFKGKHRLSPSKQVLNRVSLKVDSGKTLGLVGESGSGKTTIGRAILGLVPAADGMISFEGSDITHLRRRARRALSRDIQVVFQDPYGSLNPSRTIGDTLSEPLYGGGDSKSDVRRRVRELLDRVQLPAGSMDRLPREFSGGQRQRVAIARAIALKPKLIVCDEPVSALDLSTQARVLDLFSEIQRDTGVAYLFISHDLDVVRHVSDQVAVLYRGDIVESGEASQVTTAPVHPYTQRLLLASPVPDPDLQAQRRAEWRSLFEQTGSWRLS